MSVDPSPDAGPLPWHRREARAFLEILVLTSFVVAQPILDVFGQSPETFVFAAAGRVDIVVFAIGVTLIPALGLWALGAVTGVAGSSARRLAHIASTWALSSLLGIQILKRVSPLLGVGLFVAGSLAGLLLAWVLMRWAPVRRWLARAWPAPVAFVLIFLFLSPVSALVLPGGAREAQDRAGDAPPVVMVIFDQLPLLTLLEEEGRIDARRFPSFGRLAADGTWYRNFTVTESLTTYSVPTLLSGNLVDDRDQRPNHRDVPDNLFTLVEPTHELDAYELVTRLCPFNPCSLGGPPAEAGGGRAGVRSLLIDAVGIWRDVSWIEEVTRDVGAQFEESFGAPRHEQQDLSRRERREHVRRFRQPFHLTQMLGSMRRGEPPTLHFVHVLVPHYPWRFFPTGIEYVRPKEEGFARAPGSKPSRWSDEPWPVELTRLRHTLQVQFADALLGDVLDRLRQTGLYDRSLVVVTSDHGHSFQPGRAGGAIEPANAHEILWVPLLIKAPHQTRGTRDERSFSAPDLLPTVADHLGIRVPWRLDGSSMLPSAAGRGATKVEGKTTIRIREAWDRMLDEVFTVPAPPPAHPYPIGPRPDLLRMSTSDLPVGPPAQATARLDVPGLLGRPVRPAGPLPALVSGVIDPPVSGSLVVLAVNGSVEAVSPIFPAGDGGSRFAMLAPDAAFQVGRNEAILFLLEEGRLRRLRVG